MTLAIYLPELRALALVVTANAVPVIAARLAHERWSTPLDAGRTLADGQRLFGAHKTWRGFITGIAATSVIGGLIGLPWWLGAGFGTVSLLADAATSMAKRRMRLPPGTELTGLDQLAEAALPLLLFARLLGIDLSGILIVTATFVAIDVLTASLRHSRWLR